MGKGIKQIKSLEVNKSYNFPFDGSLLDFGIWEW